jgi:copper chaperone CopZ
MERRHRETLHFCSRGCRDQYEQEGFPARTTAPYTPSGYTRPGVEEKQMETQAYTVPGMHCGHCQAAVTEELEGVPGVESVEVDLDSKLVTVTGHPLDDTALRAAIREAGYEVAA